MRPASRDTGRSRVRGGRRCSGEALAGVRGDRRALGSLNAIVTVDRPADARSDEAQTGVLPVHSTSSPASSDAGEFLVALAQVASGRRR
jgi:hypothetical protein